MSLEGFISWLVIGAIIGWLTGVLIKGYGLGPRGNIVYGIIGAVIGGVALHRFPVIRSGGLTAEMIHGLIGAVVAMLLLGIIRKLKG